MRKCSKCGYELDDDESHCRPCQRASGCASATLLGALVEFIEDKLADAEKSLQAREEMERVWRSGTDESWRAVGCKLGRIARLHESATHSVIAGRKRYEIEMYKKVIEALKAPNKEFSNPASK